MTETATKPANSPAKVLIVDGQPAVREGLVVRISPLPDLEVCGEASDGVEALEFVKKSLPDVAIVEISLKSGSGIELIRHLKERHPALHVMVWSMHADSLYAERALRAGADGYINKDQATDHVIEAIRHVLSGRIYLSASLADLLLRRSLGRGRQSEGSTPVELLSDRELEAYLLIGEGLSTREVAQAMNSQLKTVETYLARIKRKLNLNNRQRLVHAAAQWALDNCRLPQHKRAESGEPPCGTS